MLVALIGPWLAPYAPNDQSAMIAFAIARRANAGRIRSGPTVTATTCLTRVIYGAPTALAVGLGAMLVASLLGILIGGVAGYLGGIVDELLMRLTDSVPGHPGVRDDPGGGAAVRHRRRRHLAGTSSVSEPGRRSSCCWGCFGWPPIARLARAEFLRLKGLDFVEAARCIGARPSDILLRHILPNAMPSLAVVIALGIGGAILAESMISFLGFGDPKADQLGAIALLQLSGPEGFALGRRWRRARRSSSPCWDSICWPMACRTPLIRD